MISPSSNSRTPTMQNDRESVTVRHTPGRWKTDTGYLKDRHILVYAGDYGIAKVYNQENEDGEINTANARLIAAAPDLLAFAIAYRLDLQERGIHEADMDECAMELLDMADKAIARTERTS